MLWTVAVIADSARCLYELFVRRLSPAERDGLWRDYVRFGEPSAQRPGKPVHDAIMLGSLPDASAPSTACPTGCREQLEFRAAAGALKTSRRLTPSPLARGYNSRSFDGVAAIERQRIERGEPSPQVRAGRPANIRLP